SCPPPPPLHDALPICDRNDEHLDGAVYAMHVKGDFYLDDFVEQGGVSNDNELIQFITGNITHGVVDLQISAPEIGCSSFTAATRSEEHTSELQSRFDI